MLPELNMLRLATTARSDQTVWHSHSAMQVGYVTQGRAVIHFAQGRYAIEPHDFYVIAAGHMHQVAVGPGHREYHGFVQFNAAARYFSRTAADIADLGWMDGRTLIIRRAPAIGRDLGQIADRWARGDAAGRLLSHCLLVKLFLTIESYDPTIIDRDGFNGMSVADHRLLQRALRFIEQRYRQPGLRVPDIARACSVSRSTLDKLFHRRLGYGPKEFLQRYRVDRAKELLGLGYPSLTIVAERTGFADLFAFSRVFKRITAHPPSRYAVRH